MNEIRAKKLEDIGIFLHALLLFILRSSNIWMLLLWLLNKVTALPLLSVYNKDK